MTYKGHTHDQGNSRVHKCLALSSTNVIYRSTNGGRTTRVEPLQTYLTTRVSAAEVPNPLLPRPLPLTATDNCQRAARRASFVCTSGKDKHVGRVPPTHVFRTAAPIHILGARVHAPLSVLRSQTIGNHDFPWGNHDNCILRRYHGRNCANTAR